MRLPDIPTQGKAISAAWGRDLILYLKSREIHSSPTVRVSSRGPGGQSLRATPPPNPVPPPVIITGMELWELYQEDEVANPLEVSMKPGLLMSTVASSLYPLNTVKNWASADMATSSTTLFWLKVSVAKTTYQSYFDVWAVTSSEVQTGASVPTDTLDIPSDTDGDLYYPIGSVTTDGTMVTDITQDLSMPVVVVFPISLVMEEGECPSEPA